MVFSSLPPYLDSSNWHHQHINHHIIGSSDSNPSLPPQAPPPPAPPQQPHGGPGSGSIRPGSMSERARQANIPMPEPAQRCPRCDSTNTKFCYFNNYSLTQPRHFCKTCRRYWTRGGALRSVPVGGGCRRNKRSSSKTTSSGSKSSPASSAASNGNRRPQTNPSSNSSVSNTVPYSYGGGLSQFQPMRFMSPLSQLSEGGFAGEMMNMNSYGGGHNNIPATTSDYHGSNNFLGFEQWKLQQFPFLGGLDLSAPGVYEFQGDGQKIISSSMLSQLGSVKMEDSKNPAGLSLMSRELSGVMQGNHVDDQWNNINMNGNGGGGGGGGGSISAANWTQLSGFASSSTSNHLQ